MKGSASAAATVAPATPVVPPTPVPEPSKVLKLSAFQACEYAYAVFSAVLPVGWTVEDALKPEFWVNVAHRFARNPASGEPDKAGSIIELRTVDHAFYARLYVRAVQERSLVVDLIGEVQYFGPKALASAAYEARWDNAKHGFDIVRLSDREIVGDGSKLKTREQANAWIETMKAH
jgi:hypothetical protein